MITIKDDLLSNILIKEMGKDKKLSATLEKSRVIQEEIQLRLKEQD